MISRFKEYFLGFLLGGIIALSVLVYFKKTPGLVVCTQADVYTLSTGVVTYQCMDTTECNSSL